MRASRQHARGEVARALHVDPGTDVFHLLLVHFENKVPVQVEDRHVLAEFAPDCLQQDYTKITPSAYLTGISPLAEAEHLVRASIPNAAIRKQLQMDAKRTLPCDSATHLVAGPAGHARATTPSRKSLRADGHLPTTVTGR